MSTVSGFWKRVGDLWGHVVQRNGGGGSVRREQRAAETHAGSGGNGSHPPAPRSEAAPMPRPGGWLIRSSAQQRVAELMDAMQTHFERQDLRAQALAAAVDRVASTLERLGESQRAQGECIAAIADQVSGASAHVAALSAFLRELPGSVHEQAQALHQLARQMESARQIDVQMVQSVERFGSAIDALRQSGAAAVQTLERLHEAEREQTQSFRSFIREQNRRFLVATIVVAALGAASLGGLTVALVMLLN